MGMAIASTTNAQLFETRSSAFAKMDVLQQLNDSGSVHQIYKRDSVIGTRTVGLVPSETIITYYDGLHMGLIIYRDNKPFELIGFWNPEGKSVFGGNLVNGTGVVKTPFNPAIVSNFKNESVQYVNGMKNGPVFYYCDCASVLRKGTFVNNQKNGLWKEFSPEGDFIRQKRIKLVKEQPDLIKLPDEKKWLEPAHCMMRNPDEINIKCPDPKNQ